MKEENLCRHCGQNKKCCESSIEDAIDMSEAVKNNDLNRLKFLIQGGKSPNIHNDHGYTALHVAIQQNRIDIVEYVLALPGINLEQHALFYKSVLHLSIESKNPKIAKMLIKKGANLNVLDFNDNTILHRAVSTRSCETVKLILTEAFDVNQTNKQGETPLHLAVRCRDFELVSMLLYYNADTGIMDDDDCTPFMRSLLTYQCSENIRTELFKYEYDYNRKTKYSSTLLSLAIKWCENPFIIDLIENAADVNYYCDGMEESLLAMILNNCKSEIFFYVFSLTNLSILTECKQSIFTSLLICRYNKEDWLKALYLILESDILSELIDHYTLTEKSDLFASFVEVFKERNISEDEFVKFVDICLCSGADVTFKDIEVVYQVYSHNKALPHLLNMKIENLPDFDCSLSYIFCSFHKNFACVLNKYYNCNCTNLGSSSVPSLLKLSRNEAIVAICTRYDINSSHWYYYILRRLNLPEIIYDFLTFRLLIQK